MFQKLIANFDNFQRIKSIFIKGKKTGEHKSEITQKWKMKPFVNREDGG